MVALGPEVGVVARLVGVVLAQIRPDRLAGGGVVADVRAEPGHVVGGVRHAAGAGVVVPGRDRRDRHDRLQSAHAGGGDPVGQRAVVRLADHADGTGGPVRGDRRSVQGLRGVPPVQPVDHRDHRVDLVLAADVTAAGRSRGADDVDADHPVAARDEVVVVEQRHLRDHAGAVVRLLLALVATAATGVVRRGVHHHRDPDATLRGFPRADDVHRDGVGFAVGVGVHPGVDQDGLADRVRVVVDRAGAGAGDVLGAGRGRAVDVVRAVLRSGGDRGRDRGGQRQAGADQGGRRQQGDARAGGHGLEG